MSLLRALAFVVLGALLSASAACAESKCNFNSECNGAGRCVDGQCVRECLASIDCPKDRPVCSGGVCLERANDASVDVGDALQTDASDTGTSETEPPFDATFDGASDATIETGPNKGYLTKCATDAECASNVCTTSSPRFCTKKCSAHGECAHGQLCAGGVCRIDDTGTAVCDLTSGVPCLEFCYGSATAKHCTHACASGADCPAGFACSPVAPGKKVCVDIERPCSAATQCPSGLGFCTTGGVGCTAKCDAASDCPLRLVGLPPYTCEDRGGVKVCVPPSDVLGSDPMGSTCSATGTNKCRSGACDDGTSPPTCAQRCSLRGGCPVSWGCFPLEDPGPPKSVLLVCTAAGSSWLGDTCARGRDCLSGICQSPGYCTRLCADGHCPDGMSCVAAPLTATDGTPIKLCTKA